MDPSYSTPKTTTNSNTINSETETNYDNYYYYNMQQHPEKYMKNKQNLSPQNFKNDQVGGTCIHKTLSDIEEESAEILDDQLEETNKKFHIFHSSPYIDKDSKSMIELTNDNRDPIEIHMNSCKEYKRGLTTESNNRVANCKKNILEKFHVSNNNCYNYKHIDYDNYDICVKHDGLNDDNSEYDENQNILIVKKYPEDQNPASGYFGFRQNLTDKHNRHKSNSVDNFQNDKYQKTDLIYDTSDGGFDDEKYWDLHPKKSYTGAKDSSSSSVIVNINDNSSTTSSQKNKSIFFQFLKK